MRRKAGALTVQERGVLAAALALTAGGTGPFYGWQIGRERSTRNSTVYRALEYLQRQGFLDSTLEDPAIAEAARRPRRRLYTLTPLGKQEGQCACTKCGIATRST